MTPLNLRPTTLDDIVFEGRNRAYGAYVLRQQYGRHLQRSLLIAISLFLLLAVVPIVWQRFFTKEVPALPKPPEHKVTQIVDVLVPPPATTKPAGPPPAATLPKQLDVKPVPTQVIPTRVVPNDQVIETPPTEVITQPTGPIAEVLTGPGEGTVGGDPNGVPGGKPGSTGTGTDGGTVGAPSAPFTYVEHMPEFMGGQEAMMKYLRKTLRYPAAALRDQVEGKVFVAFTVSTTGDITDVEVVKGLGSGIDEEAVRVVKQMPRWKPGQQNHQTVNVRYTLPITFKIN